MFTCDGAIRGLNELTQKVSGAYGSTFLDIRLLLLRSFLSVGCSMISAVSFRLVEILLLAMGFVRGRHVAHDSMLE